MFLLAGVLRLVMSHHLTFCINSLAHAWGTQPYSKANTARDNGILSLLTFGEGYHNFHHQFAHDYRNGVRWWQWDPSKWLISSLGWMGLAAHMKRTSWFTIHRAMLDLQFLDSSQVIACQSRYRPTDQLQVRMAAEYEIFTRSIALWTSLQEQRLSTAKQALLDHWEKSSLPIRVKALERRLLAQHRRMNRVGSQLRSGRSGVSGKYRKNSSKIHSIP